MNAPNEPAICPRCKVTLPASGQCSACEILERGFSSLELPTELFTADGDADLGDSAKAKLFTQFEIGSYRIVEEIGEGGFGIVYRAEQRSPIRREVALKVIKPGMDSLEIIRRFEAERQALALMEHPNIAQVFDAGATESGRPYFVMELVRGQPITTYCDERKLTILQRLELFIPVCQAVQHAHQKAVLHRDLKPSNILVMEVDGKPVPKVIDFGIAKALDLAAEEAIQKGYSRTQQGSVIGTLQYMSPEQAGSVSDVDTRSDIYALGAVLYEMLTGQTPLTRERLKSVAFDEVLRVIREEDAERPSLRVKSPTAEIPQTSVTRHTESGRLARTLSGDLDWIVMKALEKDRTRRYETANGFAEDIRRFLANEPVSAAAPGVIYRVRKFARRNKVAFTAGVAVFASLTVGILVSLWQAVRARDAEKLAKGANVDLAAERDAKQLAILKQQELLLSASRQFHASAAELASNEDAPRSVAHLVEALRLDPSNTSAAAFLGNLLTWRSSDLYRMPDERWASYKDFEILSGQDGKLIAMRPSDGSGDLVLRILSLDKIGPIGDEIRFAGHQSMKAGVSDKGAKVLFGAEFVPNSSLLVTRRGALRLQNNFRVATEGTILIEVWDSQTGRRVGGPCEIPATSIHQVHVSADGRRMACISNSGAENSKIQLFSLEGAPKLIGQAELAGTLARVSQRNNRIEVQTGSGSGDQIVCSGFGGRPLSLLIASSNKEKSSLNFMNVDTAELLKTRLSVNGEMNSVECAPNGSNLIIGYEGAGNVDSAAVIDVVKMDRVMPDLAHAIPLAILENGKQFYCARGEYGSGHLEVVDLLKGSTVATRIGHPDSVHEASLSPDGQTVAAITSHAVLLWNMKQKGKSDLQLPHDDFVNSAEFSSDGQFLWTLSSTTGRLRLWRSIDGALVSDQIMQGQVDDVVATGSHSCAVKLKSGEWAALAIQTPAALPLKLGLEQRIENLKEPGSRSITADQYCVGKWHPSGNSVAVFPGIYHEKVCFTGVWKIDPLQSVVLENRAPSNIPKAQSFLPSVRLSYSADGMYLVASRSEHGAFIWSTDTAKLKGVAQDSDVSDIAFWPDSKGFLCFDRQGGHRSYNADGSPSINYKELKLGFGSDRDQIPGLEATGYAGSSRSVVWWRSGDGQMLWSKWSGGLISPTGSVLVGPWYSSRSATVTDFKNSRVLGEITQPTVIESATFSPDGKLLATAGFDGVARVFRIPECKPIGPGFTQGTDMRGVEFALGGQLLLARCTESGKDLDQGSSQIWSVGEGKPITPKFRHRQSTSSANLQPQGRWLLSTSSNSGYLWGLMLPSNQSAPAWVPDFATWASGVRLRVDGGIDMITWQERQQLRKRLETVRGTGGQWEELLAWALSTANKRTVQPFHASMPADALEASLSGSRDPFLDLNDAYECALEHPLAQLALAAKCNDPSHASRLRMLAVASLPESARRWGGKSEIYWCEEASRICRQQNDGKAARIADIALSANELRKALAKFDEELKQSPEDEDIKQLREIVQSRLLRSNVESTLKQCGENTSTKAVISYHSDGSVSLDLSRTDISDLSKLAGLPLRNLALNQTAISDLSPLAGLPITSLWLLECRNVTDLSPLRKCPQLQELQLAGTGVSDLSGLAGVKLAFLAFARTEVTDLSPLRGMPLERVFFDSTKVTDVSPLLDSPTIEQLVFPQSVTNVELFHKLPKLKFISERFDFKHQRPAQTTEEFWAELDPPRGD